MFISCHEQLDVQVDDVLALVFERVIQNLGAHRNIKSRQEYDSAQSDGVLHDRQQLPEPLHQLPDRNRNRRHPRREQQSIAVELVGIEEDGTSGADFSGVPFYRVLVQGDDGIQPVPVGAELLLSDADAEPDMPAADDGLIAVISKKMQAKTGAGFREGIAGLIHSVTGGPSNPNGNLFHSFPPGAGSRWRPSSRGGP